MQDLSDEAVGVAFYYSHIPRQAFAMFSPVKTMVVDQHSANTKLQAALDGTCHEHEPMLTLG